MKETPEARKQYDDIIDLPYAKSKQHHMSLSDRAAQFAPFAALSGYDDMVQEEARLTDSRIDLSEEELDNLNHQLIKEMSLTVRFLWIKCTYSVSNPRNVLM